MLDKLLLLLIRFFTPTPFYIAFAISFIGIIFDYSIGTASISNEVGVYGLTVVLIGYLIRLAVGTLFWGAVFWFIFLVWKKITKKV